MRWRIFNFFGLAAALGALAFASCTDAARPVPAGRPTHAPSASPQETSTVECSDVRIPRRVELDTNLDRANHLLTVSYTTPGTDSNVSVTVRYQRPECSYSENPVIRRAIVHALATARPGKARGTYVIARCFKPVRRPSRMVLACADYGLRANHLEWSLWTANRAQGAGAFVMKDFTGPERVTDGRRGRIVLNGRRYCIVHERFTFWSGRIILDRPVEGRRRLDIYPSCGVRA